MLKVYDHTEIDRQEWDAFLTTTLQANIYAQTWYLDAVVVNWKALVWRHDNKIVAFAPFYVIQKFCIQLIAQPIFCQQFGLYTQNSDTEKELLPEMISWFQKNALRTDYFFNLQNNVSLEAYSKKYNLIPRLTHLLNLQESYENLYQNYSSNHKRNIKKAQKAGLQLIDTKNPQAIISLFRETLGNSIKEVRDKHYQNLERTIQLALQRKEAEVMEIRDEQGNLLAGAVFLFFQSKIIYLFGASSDAGKNTGAMALLFDLFIKERSGQNLVLDFEGSNIESLARFYKGFGGKEAYYYHLNLKKAL